MTVCTFQSQRMYKLSCNRAHFTCQQGHAQNHPRQASTVLELRTSPDVQAGFRKGRGTRDQIVNICWIIEKAREFQENIYFCFIDYAKALTVWSQDTMENSSRDGNTRPPDLPVEKSVCRSRRNRPRHGKTDWFQTGKGVRQAVYCYLAFLTCMQSTS